METVEFVELLGRSWQDVGSDADVGGTGADSDRIVPILQTYKGFSSWIKAVRGPIARPRCRQPLEKISCLVRQYLWQTDAL